MLGFSPSKILWESVQDMEPTAEDLKQFAKEEPKAEEPPPEVGNLRCCWCLVVDLKKVEVHQGNN